jgi:hypothetical protein
MIFELISWIYISLVCLIWGDRILKLFFGIDEVADIDLPVVCFIGMSVIGIISFYLSLVIPLFAAVKLILQIPALLFLLKSSYRKYIYSQVKKPFIGFSVFDVLFLCITLLMILFLCTSPVIHPDTLNYHVFSTQIFDRYGSIPGIANLRVDLGFQSMWFAVTAFFDFPTGQPIPWYPLNGCVMAWVILFLVSKGVKDRNIYAGPKKSFPGIWYLLLIIFSLLSWTQIRLTAASLSPDFIATISVLLGFYFFIAKNETELSGKNVLLAAFFSVVAVSVKLSAAPIMLIPLFMIGVQLKKAEFLSASQICLLVAFILTPIVVRNIISTGYPFYPSSFAAIYPTEWRIKESGILKLQHYITAYARYPVLQSNADKEYHLSLTEWLPVWWKHLYLIDIFLILLVIMGIFPVLFFINAWKKTYSGKELAAFFIALTGSVFWFIEAPDPRFGTGFLLPFIYFL